MGNQPPTVLHSESELEQLFDLSFDLLASGGFDGYFKRVNPAFERTLGYTTQELLSRPFLDFVHPDDVQMTRDLVSDLLHGKDAIEFENRIICADGSVCWLQWNTRSVPGEGRVYGVARDVTERRRIDAELRETQRMAEASRDELHVLVEEQAALRRVATLVAGGAPPDDVLAAVAEEVGRLVSIDGTMILRYGPDGTATVIAGWSESVEVPPELQVGARQTPDGESVSVQVFRTGRPARIDSYATAAGVMSKALHGAGVRSAVGAPIVVEGRLWGVVAAGSTKPEPLPPGMEFRLAEFTDLVATAIANAESRAELTASRARIVAASDDARRRIERDLHDGAQQRLVSLGFQLRAAKERVPSEIVGLRDELSGVAEELESILDDLREMSRGIHPAFLTEGGLAPALKMLARRAPIPVEVEVHAEARLPEQIEVAVYYVASEALTNAAKHAQASVVRVIVEKRDDILHLSVRDDGVGGADPVSGTGLIGLRDRVEAVGGSIEVSSPFGEGTLIAVELPA